MNRPTSQTGNLARCIQLALLLISALVLAATWGNAMLASTAGPAAQEVNANASTLISARDRLQPPSMTQQASPEPCAWDYTLWIGVETPHPFDC